MIKLKKTILFLSFILFCSLSLIFFKPNNKEAENINPYQEYPFYKSYLHEDYVTYQNIHNTSIKQSIINVNIGLNKPFYTNVQETKRKNSIEIIVNKYNYVPKDYVPKDLVDVNNYNRGNVTLNKEARDAFYNMAHDLEKENLHIRIISGYRSIKYQEDLYNSYLKNNSQEKVDTYSARSGFSEHHTGLAIDVDNGKVDFNHFQITEEFKWLQANAYKYGFILRYPYGKEKITGYTYEPWHYRYVGKDIAKYIYDNDITFEEYYYEFIDIK